MDMYIWPTDMYTALDSLDFRRFPLLDRATSTKSGSGKVRRTAKEQHVTLGRVSVALAERGVRAEASSEWMRG